MAELTIRQAEDALIRLSWALDDKDQIVLNALESGVTKSRVARLSGLSRSTVDRILARRPAS